MIKKLLFILMIGLLHTSSALSQSLASYYKSADDLKKAALKTALCKIISNHKEFSYSSLWSHYATTDACIDNPSQVYDMFSTETFYFSSVGSAMNKEHVVPQSWWGKGAKYPIYSDLLNVYPSEAKANTAKSNYPIGKITGSKTFDNGRIMVGVASNAGGSKYVLEPYDEFKGDFARVYLYDATCYQDLPWESVAYAFPEGGNTYPTLDTWIIPTLLEWNRLDPPSEWEITRNDRVYALQGNRNPYIDYPQLAEYIWGDSIDYAWDLDTAVPHSISGGTPDNPESPDSPDDPDTPDTPVTPVTPGDSTAIYDYDFADIENGNSNKTSGSSTAWSGNQDYISSVSVCYAAGSAVRLGTGSKSGSVTTVPINTSAGSDITVDIEVKGWSTVEGTLNVTVEGEDARNITYSATMTDNFEKCSVQYSDITVSNPTVTVSTSTKRCFINRITVYNVTKADAINALQTSKASTATYNLAGQRVDSSYKGFVIRNGRKMRQ